MSQDTEQLRLLSLFHYILAGVAALFALFPIIHLIVGVVMIVAPEKFDGPNPPPAIFGWFFAGFAALMILAGMMFAGLVAWTGRCLAHRRWYTFCLVMAGLECLFMPIGTALGVFTIVVLSRESVKELFVTHDSWGDPAGGDPWQMSE